MLLPQKQTNPKNCLATAFAMVMGVTTDHMIRTLGHDGSKDGHHYQEIAAAFPDHVIAEHASAAYIEDDGTLCHVDVPTPYDRFKHFFLTHDLVLGLGNGVKYHAVAWCHKYQSFVDPKDGVRHPLSTIEGQVISKQITTLWVVLRPSQVQLSVSEKPNMWQLGL